MIDQASFDDIEARVEAPVDELSSDERFFVNLLKDLKIKFIRPQFTSDGVRYDSLSEFTTYYSTNEITQLLESLTNKGYLEKVDYGVVALCPNCQSPTHLTMLVCQRCGSTKVRKLEKIRHHECGYWGEVGEFVDGFKLRCPSCGEPLNETATDKDWSVSDPYFECQECGSVVNKDSMRHICKRCRNVYTPSEASIKNPVGYKVVESRPEKKDKVKGSKSNNLMESLLTTIEVNTREEDTELTESLDEPSLKNSDQETVEEPVITDDVEDFEEEPQTRLDELQTKKTADKTVADNHENFEDVKDESLTTQYTEPQIENVESQQVTNDDEEQIEVQSEQDLNKKKLDEPLEETINEVDDIINKLLNEYQQQNDTQHPAYELDFLLEDLNLDEEGAPPLETPKETMSAVIEDETSQKIEVENTELNVRIDDKDNLIGTEEETKLSKDSSEPSIENLENRPESSETYKEALPEDTIEPDLKPEKIEPPLDYLEEPDYLHLIDSESEQIEKQSEYVYDYDSEPLKWDEIIRESYADYLEHTQEIGVEEILDETENEEVEDTKKIEEILLLENKEERKHLLAFNENPEPLINQDEEKSPTSTYVSEEPFNTNEQYEHMKAETSKAVDGMKTEATDINESDYLDKPEEVDKSGSEEIPAALTDLKETEEDKEQVIISQSVDDVYSDDNDYEDYKRAFKVTDKGEVSKEVGKVTLVEDVDEDYLDYLKAFGMVNETDESEESEKQDLEEAVETSENDVEAVAVETEVANQNETLETPDPDDTPVQNDKEESYNSAFQDVEDFLQYVTKQSEKEGKKKKKEKSGTTTQIDILTDQVDSDMTEIINTE